MLLTPVRVFLFFVLREWGGSYVCRIEYVRSVLRFSLLCAYVHCQKMVHKVRDDVNASNLTRCMFLWMVFFARR
ncbi:hypothetical protein EDB89DRAFT_1958593, partial [Lactarius sanguifluus]